MTDTIVIRCYDDLIEAMRARVAEIGVTMETLDSLSGLQPGYCGKLLGAAQVKTLGVLSFNLLMETLALELVPRANPAKEAELKGRWTGRERPLPCQPNRLSKHAIKRLGPMIMRELGRLGGRKSAAARSSSMTEVQRKILARRAGKSSAKKLTPEQRRDRARRAANSRWRKPKG